MDESTSARYERWRVPELLRRYPGLRIRPSYGTELVLAGDLHFRVKGPKEDTLEDSYNIELRIPANFPRTLPMATECAERIDRTYHKLEGGALCLAAPTALRIRLTLSPTLLTYVEEFVIPYLYGYSWFEKDGSYPYGELRHGDEGVLQHLASVFQSKTLQGAHEFIRLAGMMKRSANKRPCPCQSGKRLGRCHNRTVNGFRKRFGRRWCRDEYARLEEILDLSADQQYSKLKRAG
jgi:hypothetical protein